LIAVLKLLFQNEWEKAYLESQLRSDQYMEAQILKAKTDKEILYRKIYDGNQGGKKAEGN
ncbi:hypothetical protein GGP41_009242, partial [Bipolaris sorokiniana]